MGFLVLRQIVAWGEQRRSFIGRFFIPTEDYEKGYVYATEPTEVPSTARQHSISLRAFFFDIVFFQHPVPSGAWDSPSKSKYKFLRGDLLLGSTLFVFFFSKRGDIPLHSAWSFHPSAVARSAC